ncbi:hypothetical protein QTJ16_006992 [Diplocarpon rosae]|uniref:cyclin-dependent kinase n=1 Tax=Diplocarpon rosae TaxID=946125 RepID=A0AAD9SU81_9HELO|nr:hypothetical protein QTJ16_006992 [Diplocarpon rosae]
MPSSPPNHRHQHSQGKPAGRGRYADMIDSWSHGDDRRDRGRIDRGVRRSPSRDRSNLNHDRRHSPRRDSKDRTLAKSRPQGERPRDRSSERRRRSRSPPPVRDSRDEVRERNRGRELLDTRGPEKPKRSNTHHSPSSAKRRKTRSPSPPRGHKKSRREASRSPSRLERGQPTSSKSEKKRPALSPPPPRRRSPDRKPSGSVREGRSKHYRDSSDIDRRGRSSSPRRDRRDVFSKSDLLRRERSPPRHSQKPRDRSPFDKYKDRSRRRERSPFGKYREKEPKRERSPFDRYKETERKRSPYNKSRDQEQRRNRSPGARRTSPGLDHPGPPNRTRQALSPQDSKFAKESGPRIRSRPELSPQDSKFAKERGKSSEEVRGSSRRGSRDEHPRDDYRPGKGKPTTGRQPLQGVSGDNHIESKGGGGSKPPLSASGANSIEVISDKMYGRGNFQGQQGYHHNPMQAAFPLKPQYNQGAQVDLRFSQSPQHHMTPNSYQGSPQHSPYGAGRGSYMGQPQYSPQSYRGSRGNYRGNNFIPRGGRGDHRGGRGGHFQSQHQNPHLNGPANGSNSIPTGAGRGHHATSGNAAPQNAISQQDSPQHVSPHISPPQQLPGMSHAGTPKHKPAIEEDDSEDLFRPSKDLQVEDKEANKKKDDEKMPPPPSRPPPTGPQSQHNQQNSNKFSFAFKASSKTTPTAPKPEISQKLSAGPTRNVQFVPGPRGPNSRNVPTEPSSARQGSQPPQQTQVQAQVQVKSQPPAMTTRIVTKKMKRAKPKPQLSEEFRKSDSVYYRKTGNESVVGSGTYGKVYKGIHVYTKALVALKKIRMEGERDGFPVTAVREIKLLQSLKHQNIVNLQEVMVEKNDCFMVFEYLSHDLTGLLNHPTFKLEEAHKKHLAKQLFEGLDYLHRRGVLHRDIKAANILVSSDGQLKIADFGLARFYAKRRQLDYTNRVITIWYRSPELLLGETQYGPAVDIWSAACVLVEIFTRHAIFPGDGGEISQLEKIYAILGTPTREEWPGYVDMAWFALLRPTAKRPNVFAEKYRERVTPAAYDVLVKMFHYDPVKRPSASEVLAHPYFTTEEPQPRQAVELAALKGDWHEFESKALRKENERKDKEARRAVQKEKEAAAKSQAKRGPEGVISEEPEAKRVQVATVSGVN